MIALDIETCPDRPEVLWRGAPTRGTIALGNLKDEEKIEAKVQEKRKEYLEAATLDPFRSRVAAIAWLDTTDAHAWWYIPRTAVLEDDMDKGEWDVLGFAVPVLNRVVDMRERERLVGFNLPDFDLRHIYLRNLILSRRLGVAPHPLPTLWNAEKQRWHDRCIDLCRAVSFDSNRSTKVGLGRAEAFTGRPKHDLGCLWHEAYYGKSDMLAAKALDYLLNDVQCSLDAAKAVGLT